MKTSQFVHKFLPAPIYAVWLLAIAGCAGKQDPADENGAGGSSAQAGSSGSSNMAQGGHAGTGSSNEIVGTFQVQGLVDAEDPATGMTKIVGTVGDGPVPSNVIWTVKDTDGDCDLKTPSAPFCDGGCGSDVCVADGVCQSYPTSHSVGDVTLRGIHLTDGKTSLLLKEVAKTYQPPAGTLLSYPAFGPDDTIEVTATGGDYAPFELSTPGVDPIRFTSTDFELDVDKPFALTWSGAGEPTAAEVYVKLDISHHGGIKGMIECSTADTGSLTISASLIRELMELGVAGFPSVVMMRRSLATVPIAPGRVRLEVSSRTESYVTIQGVTSCLSDEDCPAGTTCRKSDATCR